MIVQFKDSVTGTAVYINPALVAMFRPDPGEPERITDVRLRDDGGVMIIIFVSPLNADSERSRDKLRQVRAARNFRLASVFRWPLHACSLAAQCRL